MNHAIPSEKVALIKKLSYGATNGGLLMISLTLAVNLIYFYTDILGITVSVAGTMFMIARIWDGINDPILGSIVDRTNTKQGKFRPYLLIGGIPLVVVSVLCFTAPSISSSGKIVYMYVTYILWGMSYTTIYIPYSAMVSSLSRDPLERASISSIMSASAILGMMVTSFATIPLVKKIGAGNEAKGFQLTLGIYAIFALCLFIITYIGTKERTVFPGSERKRYSFAEAASLIGTNGPLICMIIATFFMFLRIFMINAAAIYFFKYRLNNISLVALFMGIVTFSMFIGTAVTPFFAKKIGKRDTYMLGTFVAFIFTVMMYFFRLESFSIFLTCAAIASIGFALPYAMLYAMVADTVEYGEHKTGLRAEGIIYSSVSLVNKLAAGFVGVITGTILSHFGYVPHAVQSARALLGIDLLFFIVPAVLTLLMLIPANFYRIEADLFQRIAQRSTS